MTNKVISIFIALAFLTSVAVAQSLKISQIDSGSVLIDQQVKLYLSITDEKGHPVTDVNNKNLSIFESTDGQNFTKIENVQIKTVENSEIPVNFLLLLDNSGSMYRTIYGIDTNDESKMRISLAKNAIRTFLNSITNSRDQVGMAVYNSFYELISKLDKGRLEIARKLDSIKRPDEKAKYTEIYGSLITAVAQFRQVKGRKAIIILSDGENAPYYKYVKEPHPVYGTEIIGPEAPTPHLDKEEISLFVINFGFTGQKDENLGEIADKAGGITFDARSEEELKNVYEKITDLIRKGIQATIPAGIGGGDKTFKGEFDADGEKISDQRRHQQESAFGKPIGAWYWLPGPFILALALLIFLIQKQFEKPVVKPTLELLDAQGGKDEANFVNLGKKDAIIGDAEDSQWKVAGLSGYELVFDKEYKDYTITGEGGISINNNSVENPVMKDGDLIVLSGIRMTYDHGRQKQRARDDDKRKF